MKTLHNALTDCTPLSRPRAWERILGPETLLDQAVRDLIQAREDAEGEGWRRRAGPCSAATGRTPPAPAWPPCAPPAASFTLGPTRLGSRATR